MEIFIEGIFVEALCRTDGGREDEDPNLFRWWCDLRCQLENWVEPRIPIAGRRRWIKIK